MKCGSAINLYFCQLDPVPAVYRSGRFLYVQNYSIPKTALWFFATLVCLLSSNCEFQCPVWKIPELWPIWWFPLPSLVRKKKLKHAEISTENPTSFIFDEENFEWVRCSLTVASTSVLLFWWCQMKDRKGWKTYWLVINDDIANTAGWKERDTCGLQWKRKNWNDLDFWLQIASCMGASW